MYASLHNHSYYSLLDGASSPEALVEQAARYEMPALALTDHDALYGAVRFNKAALAAGIKPIFGTELTLANGGHLTLLAETQEGYANISRLITLARDGQEKGTAALPLKALTMHTRGIIALSGCKRGEIANALLRLDTDKAIRIAERYKNIFGPDNFFLEIQRHHEYEDRRLNVGLKSLAQQQGLKLVATSNVHYVTQDEANLHDVLTCIRYRAPIDKAGSFLRSNDEFFLRSPAEMMEMFVDLPDALRATWEIAQRCNGRVPLGPQSYPAPPLPPGATPKSYLKHLCYRNLTRKLQGAGSRRYEETLEHELKIIFEQDLTNYFLLMWDVVEYARQRKILCQGRGSAANSLVAYLLGISPIDPIMCGLVFERFLSAERVTPPDIDIDFAANRREEVIQYMYRRFGFDQIGMACTYDTFGAKQALRDVGMVFGFAKSQLDQIIAHLDTHSADRLEHSPKLRAAFGSQVESEPWQQLMHYAAALDSYPRHLGIHVGGMVIAARPALVERMPIEPATMQDRWVVQMDKYALEDAGYSKADILSLPRLAAIEDTLDLIEKNTGRRPDLRALKFDDPAVYDMICRGETVGIFSFESRAQANIIPDFLPRCLLDLTILTALIRPGPVQGNMVHPYLKRRQGKARVTYWHPRLRPALEETLGVIIFQEQVIKVARDLAGFTASEGELLRRALGGKRPAAEVEAFHEKFLIGAEANGVARPIAEKVFEQLRAFGGYSFSKGHAAAFAGVGYWSAWLRRYYPAEFFAGILRNQPMGFYPPHTIVSEAKRCRIEVLNLDLRSSPRQTTMEGKAIRLGLDYVQDLKTEKIALIELEQPRGPFTSLADLARRVKLARRDLENVILAGGLDYLGERRDLLWDIAEAFHIAKRPPQFQFEETPKRKVKLKPMTALEKLASSFAITGVAVEMHITALRQDVFKKNGACSTQDLRRFRSGSKVKVGGLFTIKQMPPTAHGVCFLTLEDQYSLLNVTVPPEVLDQYQNEIRAFGIVEGELRRKGANYIYIQAKSVKAV